MRKFKPLKELVKALTYIGDAIAGKIVSDTQNESNEYDGIIYYYDGQRDFTVSSGIKNVEFSSIVKLGDIASKNLINDLNAFSNADWGAIKVCSKSSDNKFTINSGGDLEGLIDNCVINIDESRLVYVKINYAENTQDYRAYTLSDSPGNLTENTVLTLDNG